MEIALILNFVIDILLIIFFLLRKYFSVSPPNVEELDEDMEEVISEITEMKSKMNVFHQEIFEYMDGILQPLNKRMATRLKREDKQNLNSAESTKRGGIIPIPK